MSIIRQLSDIAAQQRSMTHHLYGRETSFFPKEASNVTRVRNMANLLETLKFKNVSSEMTDDEFDEFLRILHRRKGRELILRLLCQQQAPSVSVDMLQIASSIIQKRENQQQKPSRWTLDTLPSSFIGEIASNTL